MQIVAVGAVALSLARDPFLAFRRDAVGHGVVDAGGLEVPTPVAPCPIREAKALVRTISLGVVSTALFATAAVEARVLE